jgi:hypothetical protein
MKPNVYIDSREHSGTRGSVAVDLIILDVGHYAVSAGRWRLCFLRRSRTTMRAAIAPSALVPQQGGSREPE